MTKLDKKIELRLHEAEKHRIKFLADKFASGNISLWVVYAALNVPRKNITQNDLDLRKEASEEAPNKKGNM